MHLAKLNHIVRLPINGLPDTTEMLTPEHSDIF